MSPNSRPPLSSRIRASFESKRPDIKTPTHANSFGFVVQDPETLRSAIDQAINTDVFQRAIATHLAQLIQPSIKSALDTIQPLVEAVYTHEMLLRKTSRSVEDLLTRIETSDGNNSRLSIIPPSTSATVTSLNGPLSSHPPNSSRPEEVGEALDVPNNIPKDERRIIPTNKSANTPNVPNMEHIKDLLEENSKDTTAKLSQISIQLNDHQAKIVEVIEGMTEMNAALTPTLQTLPSMRSFSEQSTTSTSVMQAQLDQLQTDVRSIIHSLPVDLGTHVKAINEQLSTRDPSLLVSHGAKLDTLSEHITAIRHDQGSKSGSEMMGILQNISVDLGSLKGHMETSTHSNNESLNTLNSQISNVMSGIESQTGILGDIRDRSVSSVSEAIPTANRSLEGDAELHARTTEILAAVRQSNESHTSHAVALDEFKNMSLSSSDLSSSRDGSSDAAVLQALAADLSSLKDGISTGFLNNGERLTGLGMKIDDFVASFESHRAADPSAEILAGVQQSNEAHASHATALEGIKSLNTTHGPETSSAPEPLPNSDLEASISNIIGVLDSHTVILNELKDDLGAEILSGLQSSNESHSAHSTALAELREADVSDEILTALHSANDSHASHTFALSELSQNLADVRSARDIEPTSALEDDNLGVIQTHISAINAALEGHNSSLSAIRDAVDASNVSHATHNAALTEIKDASLASNDFHASHIKSLAEIKATQPSRDLSESSIDASNIASLEPQISTIITSLDAQATKLSEIREAISSPEIIAAVKESHALLTSQHELLTSHTSLLDSIKYENAHDDIMQNITSLRSMVEESRAGIDSHGGLVKDLHEETKSSNSQLTTAIAALALGGAAGAGAGILTSKNDDTGSAELLEEVKAMREIVEKTSSTVNSTSEVITSISSNMETNNNTMTTTLTAHTDELKAGMDDMGRGISDSITVLSGEVKAVDGSVKAIDITSLTSAFEECKTDVKNIKGTIETLDGHMGITGSQVAELLDGVHLNDKGVSQLGEHATASRQIQDFDTSKNLLNEPIREIVPADEVKFGLEPEPEVDGVPVELHSEDEPAKEAILVEEPAEENSEAIEASITEHEAAEDAIPEEESTEEVAKEKVVESPAEHEAAEEIFPEEEPVEEDVEPVDTSHAQEEPVEDDAEHEVVEETIPEEGPAEEIVTEAETSPTDHEAVEEAIPHEEPVKQDTEPIEALHADPESSRLSDEFVVDGEHTPDAKAFVERAASAESEPVQQYVEPVTELKEEEEKEDGTSAIVPEAQELPLHEEEPKTEHYPKPEAETETMKRTAHEHVPEMEEEEETEPEHHLKPESEPEIIIETAHEDAAEKEEEKPHDEPVSDVEDIHEPETPKEEGQSPESEKTAEQIEPMATTIEETPSEGGHVVKEEDVKDDQESDREADSASASASASASTSAFASPTTPSFSVDGVMNTFKKGRKGKKEKKEKKEKKKKEQFTFDPEDDGEDEGNAA